MQKFLIVGGGLAGSCLAVQLTQQDNEVTLIDSGVNVSSRVAAGMINPLVFRRMTKSWRLDEFLSDAKSFYQTIEKKTDTSFFHPLVIRRFFSSEQERNFWLDRQHTEAFSEYMEIVNEEDEIIFPYANQFGSGRVKNSFYLDTELVLKVLQSYANCSIRKEVFNYEELNPETATYQNEQFDTVIFCEGYQSNFNPWFSYLPVNPTKGELLTVKTGGLSEQESLNRKCFTLHIGNGEYKIGSTYVWDTMDTILTEEGKNLLLDNLRYLTDKPVEIVSQTAGVRPTTKDRRPFMGRHPEFEKLAIFNGLGAKGYLMAPLLSKEMSDFLTKNIAIDKECGLARASKLS